MKFFKIMAVAVTVLCMLFVFASCKDKEETPAPAETESESETRFDYFAIEDFDEYINLDKSVYENMTVEIEGDYTVSDEMVDDYISRLLFSKKTKKNGDEKVDDEPIKRGDTAYIFYRGEMLDEESGKYKEFDGGSNMTDTSPYALSIGSNSFIDGFEDALIGVVPSETGPKKMLKLDLKFPDDYRETSLAGKDVVFYVYVSWVIQYEIPEYNEKFIKETLKYKTETEGEAVVAEHKEHIRKTLQDEFDASKNQLVEQKIWGTLYDKAEILQYPESELTFYYNSYYEDLEETMAMYNYYYGYGFTKIEEFARWYFGLEEGGDWEAELEKQAKQSIAQALIYHFIAAENGIEVSEEDFNKMVQSYIDYFAASGKNYSKEQVLAAIGEASIKEGVLYSEVMEFIRDKVTVTVKPTEDSTEG